MGQDMSFWERIDLWTLIPVVILTIIGLVALNLVFQHEYGQGPYARSWTKQLVAVALGAVVATIILFIQLPTFRLLAIFSYGVSIALLIWVKIDSYDLSALTGADSWMRIPLFGSFQPSELAKISVALLASEVFGKMKRHEISELKGLAQIVAIYGLPLVLILMEPDLGTSLVILFMFLVSIFIWGIRWSFLTVGFLVGLMTLPGIWFFYLNEVRRKRILSLLFPGHDAKADYQINQALKALANGGLFGSSSDVSVPVPVKESDFIFTAIGEYFGFIGSMAVLILFTIYVVRVYYLALQMEVYEPSAAYLLIALISSQAFHIIENIGMNLGLLPITGIPLPYISDGGTAMVMNFITLGLILNVLGNLKEYRTLYRTSPLT